MICNDSELRAAWKTVVFMSKSFPMTDSLKGFLDFVKRDIRDYYARQEQNPIVQAIDEGLGTFTYLIELPTDISNLDEATRYFIDQFYREAYPSPYDCTGQVFTTWHLIYQRESDGRWMCWHSMAMDV